MSGDFNGPLSEIAKHFAQHAQLPPAHKASARISYGSVLLAGCIYTAVTLGPDAVHEYPPAWLYGFCAVAFLGLLLFVNGLRGPRLPVEFMTCFWSLFWAAAFGAGSWALAVYYPDWWANLWVRCFCISFTAAQAFEFLLLLRPVSNDAERLVRENIAKTEFNWD